MSKGSKRRPGEGYEQAWERIFGKKPGDKPVQPVKKEKRDGKSPD